jgi:hypothetical protein
MPATTRLAPRAVLLLDRHYNSLRPYQQGAVNIYAVQGLARCAVRYAAVAPGRIILRPYNPDWPVELVKIPYGKGSSDYIVGRVCHIAVDCEASARAVHAELEGGALL